MNHLEPMWKTERNVATRGSAVMACVAACHDCTASCLSCADACVHETTDEDLARCIGLNLDCAAVCTATAQVLARSGDGDRSGLNALLRACIAACRSCAEECSRHGSHMDHCRVCAEACRECEQACLALLNADTESK